MDMDLVKELGKRREMPDERAERGKLQHQFGLRIGSLTDLDGVKCECGYCDCGYYVGTTKCPVHPEKSLKKVIVTIEVA